MPANSGICARGNAKANVAASNSSGVGRGDDDGDNDRSQETFAAVNIMMVYIHAYINII